MERRFLYPFKKRFLFVGLPKNLCDRVHFQNCSVFVQGQNLFTITNYAGLDPETKSSRSLPPSSCIDIRYKVEFVEINLS